MLAATRLVTAALTHRSALPLMQYTTHATETRRHPTKQGGPFHLRHNQENSKNSQFSRGVANKISHGHPEVPPAPTTRAPDHNHRCTPARCCKLVGGDVSERPKEPASKAGEVRASGGSNPSATALA